MRYDDEVHNKQQERPLDHKMKCGRQARRRGAASGCDWGLSTKQTLMHTNIKQTLILTKILGNPEGRIVSEVL